MANTPARTFRLSKNDLKLLKELARKLNTNETESVRLAIRAAHAKVMNKKPIVFNRLDMLLESEPQILRKE